MKESKNIKKLKKIYRWLGSLKVAIFWLLFIGLLVIQGAVVPQGPAEQIQNGSMPEMLKTILISIQAHDTYHSPLFLFSLAGFFLSIYIATEVKIVPITKSVFRKSPTPKAINLIKGKQCLELENVDMDHAKKTLKSKGFKIIKEKEGLVHFEKMKWMKLSAITAHVSMFVILIGTIIGVLTSFKSTVALVPSESASLDQIISMSKTKGKLVKSSEDKWAIKINKFWIDTYDNGDIKQYNSDISVINLSDSKEMLRKTIWVNEPLVYDSVYFYQASWGISHLNIEFDGEKKEVILQPLENNQGNVSKKMTLDGQDIIFFLDNRNQVFIFDMQGNPQIELKKDVPNRFGGQEIIFKDVIAFTGLQVKKDLGIPIVYIGFILIILALMINFLSFRQLFLIEESGKYYLAGKTNRSVYLLEQEINKFADLIENSKKENSVKQTNVSV